MRPFDAYHRPFDTHTFNFALYCVIEKYYPLFLPCNALYVIARSNATWQSPGRESAKKPRKILLYLRGEMWHKKTRPKACF